MALKTTGEVEVAASRPVAFAFVSDPTRLAACIPGCRDLREVAPGRFEARLSSRIAVSVLDFKVQIEVGRVEPPRSIEASIAGDAIGLSGRVSAMAGLELEEANASRTVIRYAADVSLTGKLGSIGQPVFRATSTQLGRQFGENLKAAVEALPRATPSGDTAMTATTPKTAIGLWRRLRLCLSRFWTRRFGPPPHNRNA
ncbi:MAG: CoxG family protein [Vicinamibacterales bacterium]